MDKIIKNVLNKIEEKGYIAYIVGGYVRDYLLKKSSNDIDIATSARPEVLEELFPDGESHPYGGIHLKKGPYTIAITTFRKELGYENRRPIQLEFINDIDTDLQRRDFYINAICMDAQENIIDPLNGRKDLCDEVIRSIGDSLTKIKEDPLRILRAIRFATTLDFTIDARLQETIRKNAHLTQTISKYRIKEEYSKILSSPNYQKGLDLSEELGLTKYLFIEYNNVYYSPNIYEMWAQVKIKDIPFTKQEKRTIIRIKETIKKK